MAAVMRIAIGIALTAWVPLIAGTIEGLVFDDSERPLSGVVVRLENDFGWEATAVTGEGGFFRWEDLPDGWYTVSLIEPVGYRLIDPPCGYYHSYVSGTETVEANFRMASRGSGVVVELGSPIGTIDGPLVLNGPYFYVGVFAYNLKSFFPDAVDRLVIRGRWYVPGVGPLNAEVVSGTAVGSYTGSGLAVSYQNLAGNLVQIELEREEWPFLDHDGALAEVKFQILSEVPENLLGKRIAFCIEDLSFHWRNSLMYWTSEYYLGTFK